MKNLTIAQIAAEVTPFTKTGGLADVVGSLPQSLRDLGNKVVIITPLYFKETIKQHNLQRLDGPIENTYRDENLGSFDVWWTELGDGIAVYFIDFPKLLKRDKHIYDAKIDNKAYYYFNIATLRLLEKLQIAPDILHCHDWHTGIIPYLIKKHGADFPFFKNTASVFTIHNLSFQMGGAWYRIPNEKKDSGKNILPDFESKDVQYINFAKRGILQADIISTVSEQYAEEILTKHFGQDLHRILQNRKNRLFGIVNGIDYKVYNPQTDPGLYQNYSSETLQNKIQNKIQFQREVGLTETTNPPMIALTSRISEQKGFDLIMKIIDPILRLKVQLVILGEGEKHYENFFSKLEIKNPKKVFTQLHFNPIRETQILAAADMMLLPSRFEPCGIGQLKSLRYGCIPIVRATGGLVDTITDYNPVLDKGNGFTFGPYDPCDLLVAITRAIENYRHRNTWQRLIKRAMEQSFSWEVPAMKYVKLFKRAIKRRTDQTKDGNK